MKNTIIFTNVGCGRGNRQGQSQPPYFFARSENRISTCWLVRLTVNEDMEHTIVSVKGENAIPNLLDYPMSMSIHSQHTVIPEIVILS